MSMASVADLRQLSADELAEVYRAGHVDVATLLEVGRADVAADRARARASAERAAWLDAAHAQYLAADAACAGRLLARGAQVADAMSLWRGSEAWAHGQASEELREWWHVNGRLSLAEYRRQQTLQRRAARDERDLAKIPAAPERTAPAPRKATPAPAPRPPGHLAKYMTALGLLERQANRTARALARVNGGIPR